MDPKPPALPANEMIVGDLRLSAYADPEQLAVLVVAVQRLSGPTQRLDIERAALLLEVRGAEFATDLVRDEGTFRILYLATSKGCPCPSYGVRGELKSASPLLAYLASGTALGQEAA